MLLNPEIAGDNMNKIAIIDTHQHLWDTNLFSYGWMHDFPTLNRPYLMPDYETATIGANIAKTVYVDTDVDECDMERELGWILAQADAPKISLAGVVACAKPENENFRAYLDRFASYAKLKGVRRVIHNQPDEILQNSRFISNLKALPAYGLSFDLCVQWRQLPSAIELVRQCPDVTFILDHCGSPNVKGKILDPWREYIRELSTCPNISCKISGLVAYAEPYRWTVEELRPYVEHCIACFGWDRVMWGGDWPVCTLSAELQQWINASSEITRHESETNRTKLFQGNAERIYRL
jgi:predicted TIM-barrel fold metal-dependent hydrolase